MTKLQKSLLILVVILAAISGSLYWKFEPTLDLRGHSFRSRDGKTSLVVDDVNGGSCGPLKVDGRIWRYPIHTPGPIEPGIHKIECGEGSWSEFKIRPAHTFHFDYWGP